jgi:hypothetical protein
MITASTGLAILALMATSFIVRVIPSFLSIRISAPVRTLLDRILPSAVFVNFAVYIIYSEVKTAPTPAVIAIACVGAMAFLTRAGLILTACTGTVLYGIVVLATNS